MTQGDHPRLPDLLNLWQQTLGWQPDPRQQELFQQLYEQILAGNQQLNLTRITTPEEFWEKHLWDSLRGIFPAIPLASTGSLLDIGTGGGFPGVPIALVQPACTVTLLDSTRKKIAFLEQVRQALNLTNIKTLVDRAEALGQQPHYREQYDRVTLRAVAPATVCAEYALPLLKLGGMAILYRGQWTVEEEASLQQALQLLGGTIAAVEAFTTPLTQGVRHCLYLQKVAPTPAEFPRDIGLPSQHPLG